MIPIVVCAARFYYVLFSTSNLSTAEVAAFLIPCVIINMA